MKKESNKPSYEELQLKIVEEEIKRNKVYDELSEVKHNLENLKKDYDNVVFEKDSITNSTIWRKTAFIRRILDRLNNKSIKEVPCNLKKDNNDEAFESALNSNDKSHLFADSIIKPLVILDNNVYSDNIHGYGIQIRDKDKLSFIKKSNKKYFFVLSVEELFSGYENIISVIKDGIDDDNYLSTNNKHVILLKDFDKYCDKLKEKIESLRAVFNDEVEIWTSGKRDYEESIFDKKLYHLKYEEDNYTNCLEELRRKLYCDNKIIPYIDLVHLETSSSIREVYLLMRVLLSYNSINNKDNYIFASSLEDNKLYDVLKKCSYNFDSIINTPSYYVERYKNRTIRYIGCGLDKTNIYEEDMRNNVVIAVQAHVFYPELIDEVIEYTNNIPYAFDLYISTVDLNKKLYITKKLENNSKAVHFYVDCFDNIGRDVISFLEQLKPVINKYKYFCHIHTKRSFQNNIGNLWRKYLYDNLLGSANSIREIIEIFETNNSIGLIFPEAYSFVKGSISIAGNMSKMEELFKLLKMNIALKDDDQVNFPSGNMFWGRFEALHNIFEMDLSNYEIPQEAGQTDDTIFHAIERAWCYVANYNGYDYKQTRYLLDNYPLIEYKKHD